jgi:hypothetical protein
MKYQNGFVCYAVNSLMTNGVMIDTFSHPAKNLLHVLEVNAKSLEDET